MNIATLAELSLGGFLVSLLLADLLRLLVGDAWPRQEEGRGFRIERRPLPWLLALAAGPGLFWDRTAAYRWGKCGRPADRVAVSVIQALWSMSYGLVLHGVATAVL